MDCLECKNLEEAFEGRLASTTKPVSAGLLSVSTELAAKKKRRYGAR